MKKNFFALLLLLLFCESAYALTVYPELGVCTGENVRLRESSWIKGKILGTVKPKRSQFVIYGEEFDDDGNKWYMIEHPTQKGRAFISAKYAHYGWYWGNDDVIPTGKDFVQIRIDYGIYPEKTKALFGKPLNKDEAVLEYPGLRLYYDEDDNMHTVEVSGKGYSLAGVQIGDSIEKLFRLGMPEDYEYDTWTYVNEETHEVIMFQCDSDSLIKLMIWNRPVAAG